MTDRTVEKAISPIERVEAENDHFKAYKEDSGHEASCIYLTLKPVPGSPAWRFVDGQYVMRVVTQKNVIYQVERDSSKARLEFIQLDQTRTSHAAIVGDCVQRSLTEYADARQSVWQVVGEIVKIQSNLLI
jgi:hypothetical protein